MTDTNAKKTKLYIKNTKKTIADKIPVKQKPLVLLCILSLTAVKANSFLCVLPLIVMQMCTDRAALYICGCFAAVYYIPTVMHTAFYVPCTAFVMVYLAGEYLLPQGKVKPVWFSATVFALSKIYVLSFGYETVYFAVFAVETAAVVMMPSILTEGCSILKNNSENLTASQLFSAACTMIFIAVSAGGIDIYGVNLPVCIMFSAALYFMIKNNIPLSMLAFICMSAAVCQDKNFSFLFAGFLVIYLGSSALSCKGEKGYVCTVAISLAVSLLFITKFNSFVFLAVTSISVSSAFLADKFIKSKVITNAGTTGEKDYLQLTQQIEKLNRCFSFIGHTVIDISNLMAGEDVPGDISDMAAQKVCRRCKNNMLCWQQYYGHTQQQFSSYANNLSKGAAAEFDSVFVSRCSRTEELKKAFDESLRLENARRLISRSGRHNQKILQNQFLIISQVLGDIAKQASSAGIVNAAYTYTINNFITSMGRYVRYCTCYQNRARCVVCTSEEFAENELERIKIKLENIYGEKFDYPHKTAEDNGILYTFSQIPQYRCEFGTASKSRYSTCGDICEFFQNEEKAFVILADGMGTGSFAAAESRTAVTMLKNLLMSEVKAETAIEITNTALNLKGTGQACVALDVLQADCFTGECIIYKAGAAATAVMNKGKTNILYKDSLPIGILKNTKIAKSDFVLENGGVVILMSDGVQANEELICKVHIIGNNLSAEETAKLIVKNAENTDDATAGIIRLVRI